MSRHIQYVCAFLFILPLYFSPQGVDAQTIWPPPVKPPVPAVEKEGFVFHAGIYFNDWLDPYDSTGPDYDNFTFDEVKGGAFTRHFGGTASMTTTGLFQVYKPVTNEGEDTQDTRLNAGSLGNVDVDHFASSFRIKVKVASTTVHTLTLELPQETGARTYEQEAPVWLDPGPEPAALLCRDKLLTGVNAVVIRWQMYEGAVKPAQPDPNKPWDSTVYYRRRGSTARTLQLPPPADVSVMWRYTKLYEAFETPQTNSSPVSIGDDTYHIVPINGPGIWQKIDFGDE